MLLEEAQRTKSFTFSDQCGSMGYERSRFILAIFPKTKRDRERGTLYLVDGREKEA